jgi:hypothetical protein
MYVLGDQRYARTVPQPALQSHRVMHDSRTAAAWMYQQPKASNVVQRYVHLIAVWSSSAHHGFHQPLF